MEVRPEGDTFFELRKDKEGLERGVKRCLSQSGYKDMEIVGDFRCVTLSNISMPAATCKSLTVTLLKAVM